MSQLSEPVDSRSRIAVRPRAVAGVAQPCICLDGVWEFTMAPDPEAPERGGKSWQPVNVPGEPAMQGFDIENGRYYYYRRTFSVPADFTGKAVALRFEGVHSDARVWVNGVLVGSHSSPATIWECDITGAVHPGQDALLLVGVLDNLDDPSILSSYASHNTGGILRSVSLLARTRTHLQMLHIEASLKDDLTTGLLAIDASLANPRKGTALHFGLIGPEGFDVLSDAPHAVREDGSIHVECALPHVPTWDAEHPRLHVLRCLLMDGRATLEEYEERIGFRRITFGGAGGSDSREVYVNGVPIKLRGVNLHDYSLKGGRCTTSEQNRDDVAMLKECNVNYVRTSHYPPPIALVEECDRQGIYLEVETAVCFQHGVLGRERVESYLSRFIEMVEACRNHPSVLIWSLGNESSWNEGFSAEYDWVKRHESSRPVKFSWTQTLFEEHVPMDLFSVHYVHFMDGINPTHTIAAGDRPYLHDEIAHPPSYNVVEMRRDPNVHNFWGESIKRHWNDIYTSRGALGAAVWEARDDIFYLPENVTTRARNVFNDVGRCTGWGCIWDATGAIKPEAWLLKNAYSPILIEERRLMPSGNREIRIQNRFNHTSLSEIGVTWATASGSGSLVLPDIGPGRTGTLTIPRECIDGGRQLALRFHDQGGVMVYEHALSIGKERAAPAEGARTAPRMSGAGSRLVLQAGATEMELDTSTCSLVSVRCNGHALITGGPYFHAIGVSTGEWKIERESVATTCLGDRITVQGTGTNRAAKVTFAITLHGDGAISVSYVLPERPLDDREASEVGISFDIPSTVESIGWRREGLWTAYPEDHIGRNEGTAFRTPRSADPTNPYGQPSTRPWRDNLRDYYLFRRRDDFDGFATNDFKAMKEHVQKVWLEFPGMARGLEISPEGDQACRVSYTPGRDPLVHASDGDIVYDGRWERLPLTGYNDGTWVSSQAGSSATLAFVGTGVTVHGLRQKESPLMRVLIDGVPTAMIDPSARSTAESTTDRLFEARGLPLGGHVVKVVVAGSRGGQLGISLFEIERGERCTIQARLIINRLWNYPQLDWGNHVRPAVRLSQGLQGAVSIRPFIRSQHHAGGD